MANEIPLPSNIKGVLYVIDDSRLTYVLILNVEKGALVLWVESNISQMHRRQDHLKRDAFDCVCCSC